MTKIKKNERALSRNDIALLIASLFCLIRGASYISISTEPDEFPYGITLITQIFGIYFWILVWIGVGIYGITSIFCKKHIKHIAWGAVAGILIAWGTAYVYGLLAFHISSSNATFIRDLVRAFEYLMTGLVIGLISKNTLESQKDEEE